jgi:hypothetical protein
MTDPDVDIFRSANLFVELHGNDAVTKARDMVRTMRERGDNNGADRWLRIIVAIEAMRQSSNRTFAQ